MAQVPEQVLAWLYKVLHEYQDVQRTYTDTARTLAAYPSLSPRTEVYTSETGASALLLTLSGTLPVSFRGTIYRFPVKLWIPKLYPQQPPMVYVTPGTDMMIRAGQHVGVDGRVYHPYLRDWANMWDRASVAEFLEFLQQVFAKEPPVISKVQQQQYQRPIGRPSPPPQPGASQAPPSLPPKQQIGSTAVQPTASADVPPPRPPKPGGQDEQQWPQRSSSRDVGPNGPPLPPLPHEREAPPRQEGYRASPQARAPISPQQFQTYGNGRPPGPPLPPLPDPQRLQQGPLQQRRPTYDRSPVSPLSPTNGYSELPVPKHPQPPPLAQGYQAQQAFPLQQPPPPRMQYQAQVPPQQPYQQAPPQPQYAPQQAYPQGPQPQQPPPQAKKQPPPDLLSDPFDIALSRPPDAGPAVPAPPIPPNPEKEHLLHALSDTLVQQAQRKVHQNLSAMAPLQAQQHALRAAQERLEAEIRQVDQLDKVLASNEAILHRSIQDCDRTISNAKSKPPPPIDEVLIAPTMVANQLWTLCAEEAACREAMYVLQKAVDRGRVGGNDFVRQMRALGRECFLKMVLARKCARGLGLETN